MTESTLSTGINTLDWELQGGFKKGSIIEMNCSNIGILEVWCYQLATLMSGTTGMNTLWIDTARTFLHDYGNLHLQAARFGFDGNDVFWRVKVNQLRDGCKAISRLSEVLQPPSKDYGLIILKTLGDLMDCTQDAERTQLEELLTDLREFTRRTGTILLITDSLSYSDNDSYEATLGRSSEELVPDQFLDYKIQCRFNSRSYRTITFNMMSNPLFQLELVYDYYGVYSGKRAFEYDMWRLQGIRTQLDEEGMFG